MSRSMREFFRSLSKRATVRQQFYTPLGSVFSGYRDGPHSDHWHVATYDQGGLLAPGRTLKYEPPRTDGAPEVDTNE